jgi:formiminoglutamase
MNLRPPQIAIPRTADDDPRVGHLLGRSVARPDEAGCVIVGFPVDEGIRRNGGRVGAKLGPTAIRRCLYKMTPDAEDFERSKRRLEHTVDLGDLVPTGDLEADQDSLGSILAPHLSRGATVVVLGGGHETSFGHFLGYVKAGRRVKVLNWDAHPDVRPLVDGKGHSGSPFRQILLDDSKCCTGYTVAGLNSHSVAKSHLDFLAEHGGLAVFRDRISPRTIKELHDVSSENTFVTFDLDAVVESVAPGVSAPNANGLSPQMWLLAADAAGACPPVRSIDIVELSPPFDRDDQTARLAALTIWCFWRGRVNILHGSE